MSKKKNFFKNVLTIGVFTYAAQAIGYLSSALVFRYIAPNEYGVFAIILVFSGFIAIFADSGFSYAVIRGSFNEAFLHKLSLLSTLLGSFLGILLGLLAAPISWFYEDPNLLLPTVCLSATFLFQGISIVPKAFLQKGEKFYTIGRITLLVQIVNSALQIILAISGFSYWSFVWASVFSLMVQALLYARAGKIVPSPKYFAELKMVMREVQALYGYTSGFNLINYWTRKSDDLLIGKFYGKGAVGVYSQAYFLLTFPLQAISNVVRQVMLPTFQAEKLETGNVNQQYDQLVRAVGLAIMPLSVALVIFPEEIVLLLRGEKWAGVAEYLPFFGIVGFIQSLLFPVSDMFIIHHAEKRLFRMGLFNSFILIAAISLGVYFSVRHVAMFYVLANLLITTPAILLVGYSRTFHFTPSQIFRFWLPRLLVSLIILLLVWYHEQAAATITVLAAAFILLIADRKIILTLLEQGKAKTKQPKNR